MADGRGRSVFAEWLRPLPSRSPGATIYGTIVAAALVAGEGAANAAVAKIVGTVLATLLVYWLAHVYSDLLARHAAGSDSAADEDEPSRPTWRALVESLAEEWGIVAGGLGLVVVLVVVDLAGGGPQLAVNLALLCAVVELVGWGVLAARRAHLRAGWVVVYALVSAALGILVGLLKLALH
jgi:hypothetical protein